MVRACTLMPVTDSVRPASSHAASDNAAASQHESAVALFENVVNMTLSFCPALRLQQDRCQRASLVAPGP
jgi:hypothetical protein